MLTLSYFLILNSRQKVHSQKLLILILGNLLTFRSPFPHFAEEKTHFFLLNNCEILKSLSTKK